MPSLKEKVSRNISWSMWTGSERDLLAILRLIEGQFESLVEPYVADQTRRETQRVSEAKSAIAEARPKLDDADPEMRIYFEERLLQARDDLRDAEEALGSRELRARAAFQLGVTIRQGKGDRREVTGSADEIADYLTGRSFTSVDVSAPAKATVGSRISLSGDRDDGISIYISSESSAWASAAFAELSEEIRRNVPSWRFLRSVLFLFPFLEITGAFGLYWLLDGVGDAVANEVFSIFVTVLYFICLLAILPGLVIFVRRTVPGFEVTRGDRRPRGLSLLVALAGGAASLVAGVATEFFVP